MRTIIVVALVIAVALVGLAPTGTAQAAPATQSSPCYHTVQPGDTLFSIGRAYGVNPWSIGSANMLVNPNYLFPGQVLVVPNVPAWLPPGPTSQRQCMLGPVVVPTPPIYLPCPNPYVVQPGDTLFGIAARFGVSPSAIAACNGLANWNYIRAYSTLWLP